MPEEYLIYKKSPTRIILNVLIFISIIAGFYYFFIANVIYFGFNLVLIGPLILLIPRLIYDQGGLRKTYSMSLIKFVENLLIIGFITAVSGSVWLYKIDLYFDWLAHFLIGIILTLIFSLAFLVFRPKISKKTALTFVWSLMIFLGILWEIYEFFGDKILGGYGFLGDKTSGIKMFGDWFRPSLFDTLFDVGFTILGSSVAVFLFYYYQSFFAKLITPKKSTKTLFKLKDLL